VFPRPSITRLICADTANTTVAATAGKFIDCTPHAQPDYTALVPPAGLPSTSNGAE
jgi:hypothetical protein